MKTLTLLQGILILFCCTFLSKLNAQPCNGITTGNTNLCSGTYTQFSNPSYGGIWTSSNPFIVSIDSNGFAYGASTGAVVITYEANTPCGLLTVQTPVTVHANPDIFAASYNNCSGVNNASAYVNVNNFPYILQLNSPVSTQMNFTGAIFGPSLFTNLLSGDIMYYSNPDFGCTPYPSGTFAGKIALIDRGTCLFELKAFHAEQAGAIGVIIVNNVPDPIVTMGGTGTVTINIPSIMISQSDGLIIKNMLSSPSVVNCNNTSYSILWNTNETTSDIHNLSSGTYTVSVSDGSFCTSSQTLAVVANDPPILAVSGSNICEGTSNGNASVNVVNFPYELRITSPSAYTFPVGYALFGPNLQSNAMLGDVLYYSSPDTGCVAYPPGTFNGKIALIDRGSCFFEQKVFNAQNAGAIGVIIVNNVPGLPLNMLNVNLYTITIPAVMISQADGQILKDALALSSTVSVNTPVYSYYWNNGSYTQSLSGLVAGDYTVYVTAENTCMVSAISSVSEFNMPEPVIKVVGKTALCNDSVVLDAHAEGYALQFNGIDQWVDINSDVVNLNDGDFTIQAWIKTYGIEQGIVVSSNNDNYWEAGERAFYIDAFGRPAFVGYGNNYILSTLAVNDGNWHHVAVSRSYFAGTAKIYIDGIDYTGAVSYVANSSSNIGTFSIGRPNFGEAINFFNGMIDEVKIWQFAKSKSEILASMYGTAPGFQYGLLLDYKLNEGIGSFIKDNYSMFYHGQAINQPTWVVSDAFGLDYVWNTADTTSSIIVSTAGSYYATLTSPLGCNVTSNVQIITDEPVINTNNSTNICPGDSVTLSVEASTRTIRYASGIFGYSSQWGANEWGVVQALGAPNVYPAYGDIAGAWASNSPDATREYVEFGFQDASPINYINIYETYSPGAIDTVYVKNPNTNLFEVVYASSATTLASVAHILHISFPTTAFPVSEIRIAINSPAVLSWNEIDAVEIGLAPNYLWSNGSTMSSITVGNTGNYTVNVTQQSGCVDSTLSISVVVVPCNLQLYLKCYLEGYYVGSGYMNPVLYNQMESANTLIADSIDVELHDANFPYSLIETVRSVWSTDGWCGANFMSAPGNYYLAVKHRNAVNTWSSMPIALNYAATYYDFTSYASQAFGYNMKEVESGIWAFYSGDINQDENLDLLDMALLEADQSNFIFGYYATDLNGDGNVDLLDSPILEANANNFIYSIHP